MGLDRFLKLLIIDLCSTAIRKGNLSLVLVQRGHHATVHPVVLVILVSPGKLTVHEHFTPITHTVFWLMCVRCHSGIGEVIGVTAMVISSHGQNGHAVLHFIRAEVYHFDDLVAYKTEHALKESGKLRVEGKDYVVQDGDIMHIRFNV